MPHGTAKCYVCTTNRIGVTHRDDKRNGDDHRGHQRAKAQQVVLGLLNVGLHDFDIGVETLDRVLSLLNNLAHHFSGVSAGRDSPHRSHQIVDVVEHGFHVKEHDVDRIVDSGADRAIPDTAHQRGTGRVAGNDTTCWTANDQFD